MVFPDYAIGSGAALLIEEAGGKMPDTIKLKYTEMTKAQAVIVAAIERAFADVTLAPDEVIFIPSAAQMNDVENLEPLLRVPVWQEIPFESLTRNRSMLSYMPERAFHFFLPAFLRASILDPLEADVMIDSVECGLDPGDLEDEWYGETNRTFYPKFVARSRLFNREQVETIILFFETYQEIYPPELWSYSEREYKLIERSLRFWRGRLEELSQS
jgi:hypothetical protein